MKLRILRESLDPATIGVLYIDGVRECDTLEDAWKDNQARVSCIPAGAYRVGWVKSPRLKRHTMRIHGVPGRAGVLIHAGNDVDDVVGCIMLGKRLGRETLTESRKAVKRVEEKVCAAIKRGEVVEIEIINPEEVKIG